MQAFQHILWYTGVQTKVPDFRSITYACVQLFQDLPYTHNTNFYDLNSLYNCMATTEYRPAASHIYTGCQSLVLVPNAYEHQSVVESYIEKVVATMHGTHH